MLAERLGSYARTALRDDVVAAFIVAVLLIPQSLAYALLAGLPPEVGVYASVLPMLVYAVLASSRVNSIGPVAVVSLMTAQAIAPVAGLPGVSATGAALVLAVETGLLLSAAALLRLDALASLLSAPVLQGFSTGAALTIALSQLPALLGSSARGFNAPEVLSSWWHTGRWGHATTAAFGIGSLVLLILARRHARSVLARWLPAGQATVLARCAPLLVIVAAIALAWLSAAGARGVALVGELPSLAPPLALPPLNGGLWLRLLPSAAVIGLVAFVSSLAVAESLAIKRDVTVSPRRELAGMAGANLAAGLGGGMPVGGSFSRGAVNFEAGARTRAAGAWAALFMALAMALLAAPLALLPKAVLAATIVMAVLSVVEWRAFAEAWRYSRGEAAVMVVVAAATLLYSSEWALGLGVALSVGLLLQHSAQPNVARLGRLPGTEMYRSIARHRTQHTPGVLALRIDESLLFVNARQLRGVVAQHLATQPQTDRVLLLMGPVNRIDLSGLEALRALQVMLAARDIRLDLAEVKGPVLDQLRRGGWAQWFQGQVFMSAHQGTLGEKGQSA